jgi:hypothetical protein
VIRLLLPFLPLAALAWAVLRERLPQAERGNAEPEPAPEPELPPEPPVQAAKRCAVCPPQGCQPPAPGCLFGWQQVHSHDRVEPITWVHVGWTEEHQLPDPFYPPRRS